MKNTLGTLLAAAATAATLLALPGCGGRTFLPTSVIPADVKVYGRLDMRDLLGGDAKAEPDWKQRLRSELEGREEYVKFREETGIDPMNDIDEVRFGGGEDVEAGQLVIVLHGRFDRDRIVGALKRQEGYDSKEVSGTTLHLLPADDGPRPGFFFPAEGYLVMVGEVWASAAVDTLQGRRKDVTTNEPLQTLIDHLDRNDTLWVVAQRQEGPAPQGIPPFLATLVEDIQNLVFAFDAPDPGAAKPMVTVRLMVRTGEPSTASTLNSLASGALQMGKGMIATQAPHAKDLLDKVQFSVEGNMAKVVLEADPALLQAAAEEVPALQVPGAATQMPGTSAAPLPGS